MNFNRLRATRSPQVFTSNGALSESIVDQVRRLGELRDAGLLSAEQFRVRKAQLLGRSI
jgi:Short C-terminal domain